MGEPQHGKIEHVLLIKVVNITPGAGNTELERFFVAFVDDALKTEVQHRQHGDACSSTVVETEPVRSRVAVEQFNRF
jgi:hypothetical protein